MTVPFHIRDRDLMWRRTDRARSRLIPPAQAIIDRQLLAERAHILSDDPPTVDSLWIPDQPWQEALERVWLGAGEFWYAHTVDEILGRFKQENRLRDLLENSAALEVVRRATTRVAAGVVRETRRLIVGAVETTITAAVRKLYAPKPRRARALEIATQAVLDATATLQHHAALAVEVELRKDWLSRQDDRVRPTHGEADARYSPGGDPGPIPLTEPFEVGDALLMHPRDEGPPEETRGCRCNVLYVRT